jgi:hypothetical protein
MRFRLLALGLMLATPALAGPPFVTDDPEPTDYQHYEIYAFTGGTNAHGGTDGEAGIDFNYGGAPDVQLTAVLPMAYSNPRHGALVGGLGNVELAVKYRFLHQSDFGWDVAVFPRVFLPSASSRVGDRHASLFVPVFVEKDWGAWSTFGGGGCTLNNGDGAKDFCQAGWVVTRAVLPDLHLGVEIYHQTADTRGGKASSGIGFGATWDLSENYHLMASAGPGIQNAADTNRDTWYAAMLFTF